MNLGIQSSLAGVVGLYVGIITYGDRLFDLYVQPECQSKMVDNIGEVRNTVFGMFIAALMLTGTFMRYVGALPMLGVLVAGLMTMVVVVSGSCGQFNPFSMDNGEIEDLPVVALMVLVLGLVQAGLQHYVMAPNLSADMFGGTTVVKIVVWLSRLLAVAGVEAVISSIDSTAVSTVSAACANIYTQIDFDSADKQAYKRIRFEDDNGKANPAMEALLVVMIVVVVIELGSRVAGIVMSEWRGLFESVSTVCALFVDIGLSISMYSVMLANDISACPTFDFGNQSVEFMVYALVMFYGVSTIAIGTTFSKNKYMYILSGAEVFTEGNWKPFSFDFTYFNNPVFSAF